ncbi:MAG: hypothetical protein QM786_15330 [Breznakibacter sp.]
MKKILIAFLTVSAIVFSGCGKDEWSDGDPAYEHIYYFGFENWGTFKNDVKFDVVRENTIGIPVQFHSERVRDYDVVAYYYVAGTAVRGTDYQIVDESGNVLSPDANGAFSMVWPNAVKGVKDIYVKALNGATGTFLVQTFDPNAAVPISNTDVSSTTNNKTEEYEVRAFSQNYKVTVTIK